MILRRFRIKIKNKKRTKTKLFRGRFFFTKTKRLRRNRKPIIRRIPKMRKRIRRALYRSLYAIRPGQKKREARLSDSYLCRYILRKGKRLFKATVLFNPNRVLNYQAENNILNKLRRGLRRFEANKMLSTPTYLRRSFKPLSSRDFLFGRVHLTHYRRNTFITISQISEDLIKTQERIVFKTSCGLVEYAGPKRKTFLARLNVARAASSFLTEKEFTSVDITFSSRIGRIFKRLVKDLCQKQIYVRYILAMKRRSHGHTRKKKITTFIDERI